MRCCKEHGHENCTHPSHEIRALRAEVERLTRERDEALERVTMPRGTGYDPEAGTCAYCHGVGACPRCWGRVGYDSLSAEVERLRREVERIATGRAIEGDGVSEADLLRAEVERLRGLIAQAEWAVTHNSTGSASCPWCGASVDTPTHAPDCPAFSARGEVRR